MIYAVIDTNVFVSAFITKNAQSPTRRIFNLLVEGKITPLYNEEILAEYYEVLSRKQFNFYPDAIETLLQSIANYGLHANRVLYEAPLPDESDRVFLEITLSREDSFLVTGNLKHFPILPQLISPAEFISRFFG